MSAKTANAIFESRLWKIFGTLSVRRDLRFLVGLAVAAVFALWAFLSNAVVWSATPGDGARSGARLPANRTENPERRAG